MSTVGKNRRVALVAVAATVTLGALLLAVPADAKNKDYIRRISARAMNLSTTGNTTYNVEIGISRWSTDEERETLLAAIQDGGTGAVTAALQNQEGIGFVRFGRATQTVRYAREFQDGDDKVIMFATDRPLGFTEVYMSLRVQNYSVSMGKLQLKANGKGEGEIAPYCEVAWNEETQRIDVGNFTLQPYRLSGTRWKDPSAKQNKKDKSKKDADG